MVASVQGLGSILSFLRATLCIIEQGHSVLFVCVFYSGFSYQHSRFGNNYYLFHVLNGTANLIGWFVKVCNEGVTSDMQQGG